MNRSELIKNHRKQLLQEKEEMLSKNADIIDLFKKYCKNIGIELNDSNFDYQMKLGIIVTYKNLVSLLDSTIIQDHEELVDYNMLRSQYKTERFSEGSFLGSNYILFASSYFRRDFHKNSKFSPRFIEHFWNKDFTGNQTSISIDFDRVRIDMNGPMIMEFDTWFGASFQEDIKLIKDGVTQLRPPQYIDDFENEFLFNSAFSLDIMWYSYDDIKVFQALEFKNEDVLISIEEDSFHPVRYVHAEFDMNSGKFRHFDGALQFHSSEEYYSRRDKNFNEKSKGEYQIKSKSKKLFKINDDFEIKNWVKFTSHFFVQNPLIIEYFSGKYPEHIKISLDAIRKDRGID